MSFTKSDPQDDKLMKNIWLLRPCETYKEEYEECSCFRGKFHQKYIFGKTLDCRQWKEDYNNCIKFQKTQDITTLSNVLEHEKERRANRLADARANDVWEYRTDPPADWSAPLEGKNNEDTLLSKAEKFDLLEKSSKLSICSIS